VTCDTAMRRGHAAVPFRPSHLHTHPNTSYHMCLCAADESAGAPDARLYESALELTRRAEYGEAGTAYEQLLCSYPGHAKGWISYGQMQKKRLGGLANGAGYSGARAVLERGVVAVEAADSRGATASVVQVG
jgi:hypothetical protein